LKLAEEEEEKLRAQRLEY
jgi:hypothetical protein